MNAITVYTARWYLPLKDSRDFFFKGIANTFDDPALQKLVLAFGMVFLQWLVLYWLYRRKIFFRV
jgi:predicted acyltransferase